MLFYFLQCQLWPLLLQGYDAVGIAQVSLTNSDNNNALIFDSGKTVYIDAYSHSKLYLGGGRGWMRRGEESSREGGNPGKTSCMENNGVVVMSCDAGSNCSGMMMDSREGPVGLRTARKGSIYCAQCNRLPNGLK